MPRLYTPPIVPHGAFREGHGFVQRDIDAWIIGGGLPWQMLTPPSNAAQKREGDFTVTDITQAYEKATQDVEAGLKAFNKVMAEFRGAVKNDLSSISAASNRVHQEVSKMNASYRAAIEVLNSADMTQAIENAERLARALGAISELKSHNITFAVLDRKPAA